MGYEPQAQSSSYARLYMIVRDGDRWIAVADPRHDGQPRGYLLSNISKEVLTHSLRLILLGETVFPSQLATAWATGQLRQNASSDVGKALEVLTQREAEILGCLTEGSPNKMIARQLGITEATVKIHVKSLIRKIGVQNRTQAALWAIQVGYVKNPVDLAA
jgi:two-component system nitrate/nitrite response regulator NarL